jgi:rhodanese-related sulfurtransferase
MKYGSSMKRHVPGVASGTAASANNRRELLFDSMVENARVNADLTIDIEGAKELIDQGAFVLDVRSEEPFAEAHIPGAWNAPLLDLPGRVWELPEDKDNPILTVCQRGNLSLSAVLYLKSLGYRSAWSVTGGTNAWREAGHETYPV